MPGGAVPGAAAGGLRAAAITPLVIEVLGIPAPKGSAQAFIVGKKGGPQRAVVAPGGSKTSRERMLGWDAAVRDAARRVCGEREAPPYVATALTVVILFRLARPAGHWGKGKHAHLLKPTAPLHPTGKPDVDKLARATLDALTGTVFDDDSRIVNLLVRKRYAAPGQEGALVTINAAEDAWVEKRA